MTKRPWMPLWIDDYLSDTTHLNAAEHGAYLLLIMQYWRDGGLPDNEEKLRKIARMSVRQWALSRATIRAFFGIHWCHQRIDRELAQVIEVARKRSAIALQMHSKRRAIAHTLHTISNTSLPSLTAGNKKRPSDKEASEEERPLTQIETRALQRLKDNSEGS